MKKTPTIADINAMSAEELAAFNKKAATKIITNFLVVPIVAHVATHFLLKALDKR